MKVRDQYERIKQAAQQYVHAVRNRRVVCGGSYPADCASIDAVALRATVGAAKILEYETHLRLAAAETGRLEIYFVSSVPPAPVEVLYP
jgi:hypothetical protein